MRIAYLFGGWLYIGAGRREAVLYDEWSRTDQEVSRSPLLACFAAAS